MFSWVSHTFSPHFLTYPYFWGITPLDLSFSVSNDAYLRPNPKYAYFLQSCLLKYKLIRDNELPYQSTRHWYTCHLNACHWYFSDSCTYLFNAYVAMIFCHFKSCHTTSYHFNTFVTYHFISLIAKVATKISAVHVINKKLRDEK